MCRLIAKLRGWNKQKIEARVEELRKLVGLEATMLGRFPFELSGGQQQRVAIMRAAMMDPAVMLLDEPMAALDPLIRRSLQQELKSIFQRLGKTVLLVTHDLGEAVFLAEQITLLHEGQDPPNRHLPRLVAAPRRSVRDGIHQCAAHLAGSGRSRMRRGASVASRACGLPGRHGLWRQVCCWRALSLSAGAAVRGGSDRGGLEGVYRRLRAGGDRGANHRVRRRRLR